jgi:glycosyltransferase involved in cell wall biosynthesis
MLSSDSEGYSLVCAEALSLGKPVISTKCTGPAEMLRGDSGILTGFSDTELANAIETLIKDDNQLKKYQRAALERASQFSPQKIMDEIYSALDGSRGI